MTDKKIKEFFEEKKRTTTTAPDGTPLYYNGPLVLDGGIEVTKKLFELLDDNIESINKAREQ